MWVEEGLNLCLTDRDAVRGGWANDHVADAVNKMVGKQLGVQPTHVTSVSGFDEQCTDTVTTLHAPQHCVTVSATAKYTDSLQPRHAISPYVTRKPMHPFPEHSGSDEKLRMSIVPSTPQTNSEDW